MLHKHIFTIVLFLPFVIICNSLAQDFNYGISVGYSRTSPIKEKSSHQENITSENYYNTMVIVEHSNKSAVRVQTGLKFFKMGYTFNYNNDDIAYFAPPPLKSVTTLSFLAIPLDFNYSLPFLSGLYLSGGIEAAKVISAKIVVYENDGTTTERNLIDNYRKLNFMFIVGIGFEKMVDNFTIFIEPEYARSLDGIMDSNKLSNIPIEQFSLNVGLKF